MLNPRLILMVALWCVLAVESTCAAKPAQTTDLETAKHKTADHKTTVTRIAIDGDVVGTPYIAEDGTIYACDKDEGVYRISPDLKSIKRWKLPWGSINRPTPIDGSRMLLVGKMGRLGVLNNKTNELTSEQTLPLQSVPGAPPTIAKDADGKLIFILPASNNKLYVVNEQLKIVRDIDLPNDAVDLAVPLSATQYVVTTIRGDVVFADIAKGTTRVVELKDDVRAAPAVFQGNIYVFTRSGLAYVFDKAGQQLNKLTHDAPFYYDAVQLASPPRLRLYDENGGIVDLTADGKFHRVGKASPRDTSSSSSSSSSSGSSDSASLPPVKVGHYSAPGADIHGVAYGNHELRIFDANSAKQLGSWTWPTQIRSFLYARGNTLVFAAPNPKDSNKYELIVVKVQPSK